MSTTTFPRLPGVMTLPVRNTSGQRHAVATIRNALRRADVEADAVVSSQRRRGTTCLPSQMTWGKGATNKGTRGVAAHAAAHVASSTPHHRPVMLLPIIDAQPSPVVVTANWPQWFVGVVMLTVLFVGVAMATLGGSGVGGIDVAAQMPTAQPMQPATLPATQPDFGTATATSTSEWRDSDVVSP